MSEADYTRQTFDLTMGWAQVLAGINPAMTSNGIDREVERSAWAFHLGSQRPKITHLIAEQLSK
jgi:hypothetical protein